MQQWSDERIFDEVDHVWHLDGELRGSNVRPILCVMRAEYECVIANLTGALVDAQSVASEQSRLRAEAEGKLAEATTLLKQADKRINELEAIVYRQAELLDEKGYTQQEAMLRFQQKRITELERQLTAIEEANNDGRLCAEGCAP